MDKPNLPFIERDPDQSGVPEGLTRYLLRDWNWVHSAVISAITLTPDRSPFFYFDHDDRLSDDEQFDGHEPTYPGEPSRVYIRNGAHIDPVVLRMEVPPPPARIEPPKLKPDLQNLPGDLQTMYNALTGTMATRGEADAIAQAEARISLAKEIVSRVAIQHGAHAGNTPEAYIAYLRAHDLLPRFVDRLLGRLDADHRFPPSERATRQFHAYSDLARAALTCAYDPEHQLPEPDETPRWIISDEDSVEKRSDLAGRYFSLMTAMALMYSDDEGTTKQLQACTVTAEEWDANRSGGHLTFSLPPSCAPVQRDDVTAWCCDADWSPIEIIFHFVDGRLSWGEWIKYDKERANRSVTIWPPRMVVPDPTFCYRADELKEHNEKRKD